MNIFPSDHPMKKRFPWILLFFLTSGAAQGTPWSKIRTPAPGPATAIGSASNGCLQGAQALPARGTGFVSIRRHRNRHYGHPRTLSFIQDLGSAVAQHEGASLLVGDLSQPRGGRMSSSHRSHQNGLDVDIWFQLSRHPQGAARRYSESADPPSMVRADGRSLSKHWGKAQRFLLHQAATDPRVDRIFVDPAIKQALCRSEQNRRWLHKLRPWWGHDAHFHVRLRCPKNSPDCRRQAPIPKGSGCDASLAWWFSEEARHPKKGSGKKARPTLPAACRKLH